MQVLNITTTYYPELQFGGPPQKIHSLGKGLRAYGHEVRVVTLHSQNARSGSACADGIPVRYLPWVGRGSWKLPLNLGRLRRLVAWADVVHLYGLYNLLCPAVALLALQLGKPYVLEPLGMYVPRARSVRVKQLYNNLLTAPMAQKAALLIATSTAEAADLQVLGCTERLVLRRNGIDLSEFAHVAGGEAFRAQHGVASGERLVLYIGRISPIKNLETLVTAFARANLKNARLLLVGPQLEEDYARRLRSLISDLRMEDRVTLTGPLYAQDKFAALDAANLFVLPSLSESYGNSAAEAVAAGVPVLLTEGCGIAPSIHGRAGLSVPATAAGLAAGLHTLLDDARRRDALISRREEVLAELSWEEPLQQMIDLYESITGHEQTERLSGLGIRRTNVVIDERSSR